MLYSMQSPVSNALPTATCKSWLHPHGMSYLRLHVRLLLGFLIAFFGQHNLLHRGCSRMAMSVPSFGKFRIAALACQAAL